MIYTSVMMVWCYLELHTCNSFRVLAVSPLYEKSGRLRRLANYLCFMPDIDMIMIDITLRSYLGDSCRVTIVSAFFIKPIFRFTRFLTFIFL
jgi:hypothetical protein